MNSWHSRCRLAALGGIGRLPALASIPWLSGLVSRKKALFKIERHRGGNLGLPRAARPLSLSGFACRARLWYSVFRLQRCQVCLRVGLQFAVVVWRSSAYPVHRAHLLMPLPAFLHFSACAHV